MGKGPSSSAPLNLTLDLWGDEWELDRFEESELLFSSKSLGENIARKAEWPKYKNMNKGEEQVELKEKCSTQLKVRTLTCQREKPRQEK